MAEYHLDNADVCFPLLAVSKFRRCIRLEAAASSLNRALLARASGSPVPLPRRPDGSGEGYHGGLLLPGRWGGPAARLPCRALLWVHRFTRMVGIPQSNDSGCRRIAVPAAFLYIRRPWLIRAFLHKQCEFLGNRATSDITERSSAPSSPLSSVHTEFKSRREAEISMPQRHRSMSCQSLPAGKVTNGFLSRHTRPSRQA